ncbi:hypothetical protein KFL_001820010 [Klebsormidium nitens]|uniref:Chromo domain-containing protein n=1 Tax=Klebsormidium nitens TaxID=105231 RepID=A0A1Y1I815_KLENI|nr:hypothetical protein KFL_001820010 [Klebsormidium nitens]|eukprot:GAQ84248.1 hypothetical protein KFL_001820010 [Klebsormidium nitens]
MAAHGERTGEEQRAASSSMNALAYPLSLPAFEVLLECLKRYKQPFPARAEVITDIINAMLPAEQQVTKVQVFNVLDKLKTQEPVFAVRQHLVQQRTANNASWLQLFGDTILSRELLKRHDYNLYYAQTSFSAAVNVHNVLYGLQRFTEAPELGLQHNQHLRTHRGALYVKRFEEGYLLSWVLRFCQELCESQLSEIDLRWPLDVLIHRIIDPFWCQLRDEALEHPKVCRNEFCGRYAHVDGNCKVIRSCCARRDVEMFETAIGRVVKGCPKTPARGKRFCKEHLQEAIQKGQDGDALPPEAGEPGDSDVDDGDNAAESDDEIVFLGEGDQGREQGGATGDVAAADGKTAGRARDKGKGKAPEPDGPQQQEWEVNEDAPVALRTRGRAQLASSGGIWEAERIVKSMVKGGVTIYLVKWKGFPSSENTWETYADVTIGGMGLMNEFKRRQLPDDFYTRDRQDKEEDPADETSQPQQKKRRITSCTPRVSADGKGHTAGTVVMFWCCGHMFPPLEMILSESTTLVHHYFMECFDRVEDLPEYAGMDDMCHWARFAASGGRPDMCAKTKAFVEKVKKLVDKFHYSKNHVGKWCKENVSPFLYPELEGANMSVCEQRFKWFGKYRWLARNMNQRRFQFLLLILTKLDHLQRDAATNRHLQALQAAHPGGRQPTLAGSTKRQVTIQS